jgi:hypothetical protein
LTISCVSASFSCTTAQTCWQLCHSSNLVIQLPGSRLNRSSNYYYSPCVSRVKTLRDRRETACTIEKQGRCLQGNLTLALADIQQAETRAPATSAAKKTTTPPPLFTAGHGAAAARPPRASSCRGAFAAATSIPQPDGIRLRLSASENGASDGRTREATETPRRGPLFLPPFLSP